MDQQDSRTSVAAGKHAWYYACDTRFAASPPAPPSAQTHDVFHSAHRPAARTAALTPIHFSHANGFPAPCYRKLFDGLGSDLRIGHLDRIGHDPRFPVTDGWGNLVDELIHAVERRWLEPVLGIGHSLGGFLTAMAAARRPDLFRAIILLDAPILGRFQGSAMQFAKRIGLIDRMTPAASTRSRRREWPSREDALAHFRRRRVFAKFDAACLEDYVRFGLVDHARGVQLWFDPDIETRIYRTIHMMSPVRSRPCACRQASSAVATRGWSSRWGFASRGVRSTWRWCRVATTFRFSCPKSRRPPFGGWRKTSARYKLPPFAQKKEPARGWEETTWPRGRAGAASA